MVDFDTNARLMKGLGLTVAAGSVDRVSKTGDLASGLRLGFVELVAELDPHQVADATGAMVEEGERPFLHATGFLLDPESRVVNSVYSSGPIGRFSANDAMKKVSFEQARRDD